MSGLNNYEKLFKFQFRPVVIPLPLALAQCSRAKTPALCCETNLFANKYLNCILSKVSTSMKNSNCRAGYKSLFRNDYTLVKLVLIKMHHLQIAFVRGKGKFIVLIPRYKYRWTVGLSELRFSTGCTQFHHCKNSKSEFVFSQTRTHIFLLHWMLGADSIGITMQKVTFLLKRV